MRISAHAPVDITRDGPVQVSPESRSLAFDFSGWHTSRPCLPRSYSLSLREIDTMRVDGKFVDADGNKAEGQYVSGTDPGAGAELTTT
jgi:hypothetical protein